MRRLHAFVVLTLLVSVLWGAGVGQASPPVQARAPRILLRTGTFAPLAGEMPDIPAGLGREGYPAGQRGYYIVQFEGPIQQAWKDQVSALGGELLDYIPEFAFKVRMTPEQAQQVGHLQEVAWVGVFQPAYKLAPGLRRDGLQLYRVQLEQGVDFPAVARDVARLGPEVLQQEGAVLLVGASFSQLRAVAQVLDVAWVENYTPRETNNEYGAGAILGSTVANANGYDGSTQIVGVADTGLGGGTASTAHPDIPASRIVAIYDWNGPSSSGCYVTVDDGAVDVDSGHGTHVSGSVLGDGGPNGEGLGTAPAARLVFQAVEDWVDYQRFCAWLYADAYGLIGLPDDLHSLFQQAYNAGARIHTNSWGSAVAGEYTLDSANTDDFIWDNPDIAILFSSGNNGIDANSDGLVDNDSLGSPSTAKNVITVGATENQREDGYPCDPGVSYTNCASQGGHNNLGTYGSSWPEDYPANPLYSDPMAGNAEQMAAFSSRGPTDDGRIKPDVVAPGTWVLSSYSSLYQEGYDASANPRNGLWQYDGWGYPMSQTYKYMGGTSMSTPLVAGGAAVVRDYYQKAHGHSASAALVKATLINSAVDILDENNDGVNDNDYPIPNMHEGWGRVDLANATDGSHQYVEQTVGLSTGGQDSYQFSVAMSGQPFKVTLVWSDYASTEAASKNLVNDLDLVVTAPGGVVYRGNVFGGGWSQTGGSADRTNNVENVYVQSAAAGTWTVQVSGYNTPYGPQPFALVVDGAFGAALEPTDTSTPTNTPIPTDTTVPTDTATPTITPTPSNTPTSTPIPTDTLVPTDTPIPTDTAIPTDTPIPTITPTPAGCTNCLRVTSISMSGTATRNKAYATGVVTVRDENNAAVGGATVYVTWRLPNGSTRTASGNTNSSGEVSFSTLSNRGTYTLTVTNITKAGYTFDSENSVLSASITL